MTRSSPRLIVPPVDPAAIAARIADGVVVAFGGATMGTRWSARIVVAPGRSTTQIDAAIRVELDLVVAEMSGWEPGSALSRFNRAAPGSWHALPPALFAVLGAGLAHAAASDGAFDPTMGALVDLWGFGPHPTAARVPDAAAIAAALATSGWRKLAIDHHARRALQPGGLALDLSGIAKGYAVDRVADRLAALGFAHALVEVGGELVGRGVKPDGSPWWVDVPPPPGASLPTTRVALHNLAIATSGDYHRFFDADGRRYAHSIDPRTGHVLDGSLAAVTVLHPRCMDADALATTLLVMGPRAGPDHAATHNIAALFVRHGPSGMDETVTPQMAQVADFR